MPDACRTSFLYGRYGSHLCRTRAHSGFCRIGAGLVPLRSTCRTRAGRVHGAELVPDLSLFVPDWCRTGAELVPDTCRKRAKK